MLGGAGLLEVLYRLVRLSRAEAGFKWRGLITCAGVTRGSLAPHLGAQGRMHSLVSLVCVGERALEMVNVLSQNGETSLRELQSYWPRFYSFRPHADTHTQKHTMHTYAHTHTMQYAHMQVKES